MPSQPFDTGWDFSPVLDLIDSDVHDVGSPDLRGRRRSRSQDEAENGETSNIGVRLGSFSKLFEQLGLAVGLSAPPLPPFDPESDLSNSDDALLPSPVEDTLSLNSKPKEDLKPIRNNKKSKKLTINTTHEEEVDVVLEDKEQLQRPAASRQSSTGSPKKKKHQSRKEAEKERKDKQLVEKEQARNEKGQKANEKAQKPVETPVVENLANESRYPLRSKAIEQPAPVHLPVPAHSTKAGGQLQAKDVEALAQSSSSRTKVTEKAAPTAAAKSNVQSQSKVVNAATQESSRNKAIEQSAHIPALKSGTHSQSKVGAQVRPTTPVQVNPQTHKRKKSGKQDKLCKGNKPSVLPITTEAVTPSHQTSAFQHPNFAPQHSTTQLFTPQTFVPNEYAQYNSFGTPAPYQYPVAPEVLLQLQSSGVLYTPMIPVGQINGLVPSTIQPHIQQNYQTQQTYQRAPAPVTPVRQATIMIRPQIDRHFHFLNQLMLNFPQDKKFLVSPMQLCNEKTTAEGIHIFVDASNIMIGFKDILRQYGKVPYDMSFDSLALLMERRRPVAKRVFAGSHREANPLPQITKLVETSKAVGYESNVNEQVFITREETERKKFFKNAKLVGWNKAAQRGTGSGSDSEAGPSVSTPTAPKWVEQGVDEILHLKMCQSIIDTEFPTTMVLATGDGAEAEHSDGFLAHVERALKKGWKVELVSWRQQTSGGYKNRKFRTKWGEQFKIIELDEYVESLIDTP